MDISSNKYFPHRMKSIKYAQNIIYVINPLKTKRRLLYLKTQFAPRSKHFISVIKTNQFMLQVAQVAVCSQINTKHTNTV